MHQGVLLQHLAKVFTSLQFVLLYCVMITTLMYSVAVLFNESHIKLSIIVKWDEKRSIFFTTLLLSCPSTPSILNTLYN